jgi:hypothetical protein
MDLLANNFSKKKFQYQYAYEFLLTVVQSDKKNKLEQALQIIGNVVAESYGNKRSLHGRQFVVSNIFHS